MMNDEFNNEQTTKYSSFIIHHSSLEHAILEFQRVKRQLLPIHPGLAAAKVQQCIEVAKGLCAKVFCTLPTPGSEKPQISP